MVPAPACWRVARSPCSTAVFSACWSTLYSSLPCTGGRSVNMRQFFLSVFFFFGTMNLVNMKTNQNLTSTDKKNLSHKHLNALHSLHPAHREHLAQQKHPKKKWPTRLRLACSSSFSSPSTPLRHQSICVRSSHLIPLLFFSIFVFFILQKLKLLPANSAPFSRPFLPLGK